MKCCILNRNHGEALFVWCLNTPKTEQTDEIDHFCLLTVEQCTYIEYDLVLDPGSPNCISLMINSQRL